MNSQNTISLTNYFLFVGIIIPSYQMVYNFVCSGFVVVGIYPACTIRLYMTEPTKFILLATFHHLCTDHHHHQVQHELSSHRPIYPNPKYMYNYDSIL